MSDSSRICNLLNTVFCSYISRASVISPANVSTVTSGRTVIFAVVLADSPPLGSHAALGDSSSRPSGNSRLCTSEGYSSSQRSRSQILSYAHLDLEDWISPCGISDGVWHRSIPRAAQGPIALTPPPHKVGCARYCLSVRAAPPFLFPIPGPSPSRLASACIRRSLQESEPSPF